METAKVANLVTFRVIIVCDRVLLVMGNARRGATSVPFASLLSHKHLSTRLLLGRRGIGRHRLARHCAPFIHEISYLALKVENSLEQAAQYAATFHLMPRVLFRG